MNLPRTLVVLLAAALAGCSSWFKSDEAHEEHRFAGGELLVCDSWVEQGFQSRTGRTMECWMSLPGQRTKEHLCSEWLSQGQTQPDGPSMILATQRLELQHSGESAALLMDNTLLFRRQDLHNSIPWYAWRIKEDPWARVVLRAILSAQQNVRKPAVARAQKAAPKVAGNPEPAPGKPGEKQEPELSSWYRIAAVEVPSLRVVAKLQPAPEAPPDLPSTLVFRPKQLYGAFSLSIEETLAANPGLQLAQFPPDVVFEFKAAETKDGATRIVGRGTFDPQSDYQTISQDYQSPEGPGNLKSSVKPAFRFGDTFVYYCRQYGVLDPEPVETALGEWQPGGAVGSGNSKPVWASLYVRLIHRGEESPPGEVPVLKHPYQFQTPSGT